MDSTLSLADTLLLKMGRLIAQIESLKAENTSLKRRLGAIALDVREKDLEMSALKDEINTLTLEKNSPNPTHTNALKARIDQLIAEIDFCLAHLNDA